MKSSPKQRCPVEELHGVRRGHLMFVNGEAKCFLFPIRVFRNFSFDERSCLQKQKAKQLIPNDATSYPNNN